MVQTILHVTVLICACSVSCGGFYYPSQILDELALVTNKAKECFYLFSIFQGFISLIAATLEGSGFIPVVQSMTQILNFLGEEVALAQFHRYFCITKFVENLL